ncbi:MAG TPA: tetratricopeptide repeat protein [Candidatus Pacearchaeota archaeon]|nr:tetratricopeptide repeat protein [Candidatus Pacearchaeota archaeon]
MNVDEFLQQIRSLSDEKKLEYIERLLQSSVTKELKIAALKIKASIYEKRKFYNSAAKEYCYIAELSDTFREKEEFYFKAGLLFLLKDSYEKAEESFRKVLALTPLSKREETKEKIVSLYFNHAMSLEKKKKYVRAIKAYETILNLDPEKTKTVYEKLSCLYEAIGRPDQATKLKQKLKNQA